MPQQAGHLLADPHNALLLPAGLHFMRHRWKITRVFFDQQIEATGHADDIVTAF
jgi:hypothetical protein